jgi:hypothetical protein
MSESDETVTVLPLSGVGRGLAYRVNEGYEADTGA